MKKITVAASALLLGIAAHAAPFQNGSFEAPGISGGSVYVTYAGGTSIPGWLFTGAGVDYIGTYWQPAHGTYSLDLSGAAAGGAEQTFDTVIGRTYRVQFSLAGNPDEPSTPLKTVLVEASGNASQTYNFDITGRSLGDMGWSTHNYTFVATSTATTLGFSSQNNTAQGPALDNVTVTDITPAPAAVPTLSQWALIGLAGLLGLLAVRGRHRAPLK